MPATHTRREAKLSLRLTNEQRDVIHRAAMLEKSELSRFVADAAVHAAKIVIHEHGVSELNEQHRARFYDLLLNPPAPSRALLDLAADSVPEGFELE